MQSAKPRKGDDISGFRRLKGSPRRRVIVKGQRGTDHGCEGPGVEPGVVKVREDTTAVIRIRLHSWNDIAARTGYSFDPCVKERVILVFVVDAAHVCSARSEWRLLAILSRFLQVARELPGNPRPAPVGRRAAWPSGQDGGWGPNLVPVSRSHLCCLRPTYRIFAAHSPQGAWVTWSSGRPRRGRRPRC
jgi:hypothetical protein